MKRFSFEPVEANHPVYIMFSSARRQAEVHGPERRGILLNQLKELVLHSDLKREDTITYMTAPS